MDKNKSLVLLSVHKYSNRRSHGYNCRHGIYMRRHTLPRAPHMSQRPLTALLGRARIFNRPAINKPSNSKSIANAGIVYAWVVLWVAACGCASLSLSVCVPGCGLVCLSLVSSHANACDYVACARVRNRCMTCHFIGNQIIIINITCLSLCQARVV